MASITEAGAAETGPGYDPSLIVCATCDTLHRLDADHAGRRCRCVRCGALLVLGQPEALTRVLGLAVTSFVLLALVVSTPFLRLQSGQFGSASTVLDVASSFRTGLMTPLALAVLVFILVLPALRAGLLIYALTPLALGWRNWSQAEAALRWAFQLKPWAMAEIFMIGVAVALVKLAGMARVEMGPAFWAFAVLVLVNAFKDTSMCRITLWTALAKNR